MTTRAQQIRSVNAAVSRLQPAVRKAFTEAMQGVADDVNLRELIAALETGNVAAAAALLALSGPALFELEEKIRAAYMGGGSLAQSEFPSGAPGGRFAFDGRHARAEAWIAENVGDFIQGIQEDSLQAVRTIIADGFEKNRTPRSIALDITGTRVRGVRVGGVLGLDDARANQMINARAILSDPDLMRQYFVKDRVTGRLKPRYKLSDRRFDKVIAAAIRDGKALTQTQIDNIMRAHQSKALGYRGRVIAKDQTFKAIAAGRAEGYTQIAERDDIEGVSIRWQHNLSENPRLDHVSMSGTIIDHGQTFNFADGTSMAYPHQSGAPAEHTIGCRCTGIYRIIVAKPT